MKNSKVSIIIPAFNEQDYIGDCLKSILGQNYPNFEVVVVDDGSTDSTVETIKKFPVKLIENFHQGPGKSRNRGVGESTGDILVFVDADMTFDKDFLEDLTKPISNGEFKGTFSKNEMVGNWTNIWARYWNYNKGIITPRMIPEDYPDEGIDFRAILKSEFIKVGGFDDIGYTDTWSLYHKLGYKPHATTGAIYYHNNPDTLNEVFIQSRWVAKREYKLGLLGLLITIIRFSPIASLIVGINKSLKYKSWKFIIFKFVYDLGSLIGLLQMLIFKKLSK